MIEFNKRYKLPLKNTSYSHVFDAKSNMIMEVSNDELRDKLVRLINGEEVKLPALRLPVAYVPTAIFDAKGNNVVTIRGWGRLSKLPNGTEVQDRIGNEIAELINMQN